MESILGKDLGMVLFYIRDRLSHLSKMVALDYEDDSEAPIAKELQELSVMTGLAIIALDKRYVRMVGDDFHKPPDNQEELPF